MVLKQFYPGKFIVVHLMGVIFLSVLAFVLLLVHWPQRNGHDVITVHVPKGSTVGDVSNLLKEKMIVSNEKAFRMAVWLLGHEKELPAGDYKLTRAESNYQIVEQLVHGRPNLIRLTVLEGWRLKDIARAVEKTLGSDRKDFLNLCTNKRLLEKWNISHDSFEGFLFPDTYFFKKNEKLRVILEKMVEQFQFNISDAMRRRARELGFIEKDVITLASIIEGEARHDEERAIISGVYHNRLKKGMKLQADPTIQYIIADGPRRLLNKDLKIESPYNTYLYPGLPPGPINNPGKESILAALYPHDNDYLYFVARGDGYHTFSKNEQEHNRAKRKLQEVRHQNPQQQKSSTENL